MSVNTSYFELNPGACRVCLAVNVRLHTIADNPLLQLVYEKLTNVPLHTADKRPIAACYICYAMLLKSGKLLLTAAKTEKLLTNIFEKYSKITTESISLIDREANDLAGSLAISRVEYFDNIPPVKVKNLDEIKTEPALKDDYTEMEFEDSICTRSDTTLKNKKDSDSSKIYSTLAIAEEIRVNRTDILCDDATIGDLKSKTNSQNLYNVDMQADADSAELSSDFQNKKPKQPEAKDPKKKRQWRRRNACIFCEKLVTNYTRHLLRHHKNESEVIEYMSINDPDPKVRKQRRQEFTNDLRNRGNFLHNSTVMLEQEGDLIPTKGTFPLSSSSTLTTCKNCLGTFKRKRFHKHFKTCSSKLLNTEQLPDSYKKRVLANHSISIIPQLSAASQEVQDHILARLRNDEISTLVKTDPLIMAYASRLLEKKKESRSRKVIICSKLRDLGNLLLHLKTEDPSIQELRHLFKPQHYKTFISCVKKMSRFNEETGVVQTTSIPSRLRPSVLGCIEVLYTEMVMGDGSQAYKDTLKKHLDEFKLLMQTNWEWEISSNAEKSRKRNLMTKETMMPVDEDIPTITEK